MIHRVVRGHDPLWKTMWEKLISVTPGHLIASEYRPGSGIQYYKTIAKDNDGGIAVPANKWAKIITRSYIRDIILNASSIPKTSNEAMVQQIQRWLNQEFKSLLNDPAGPPAKIVFDELIPDLNAFFETFFNVVNQTTDPVVANYKTNFSVYIWPGTKISYSNVQKSLISIMKTGADLLPELYFKHSDFCDVAAKEKMDGADKWMRDIIVGKGNEKKIDYLYGLKQNLIKNNPSASGSGIYPIIPVGYPHLNLEKDQERFPVRIMHNTVSLGTKYFDSFNYNGSTRQGFGSYKWSINAMGVLNFDDESPSWSQLISEYVNNPEIEEEQRLSIRDFEKSIQEANIRAERFIEGWNYYCKLTKKEIDSQLTKGQKKLAPLRNSPIPNCSANSIVSPIGAFKGIGYQPVRWNGEPSIHRKKNAPINDDLIQKGNTTHAFLAKTVTPFNNARGIDNPQFTELAGKGFYQSEELINAKQGGNTTAYSRFDLWVTEVNYGFSAVTQNAVSKYYTRAYSRALQLTPIKVEGVCYDENEYDDLADFIREGQLAISQEPKNTFRLYIPAAKIDCIGVIESFQGGFNPNNQGIPTAPKFEFDFVIFKDLNDDVQTIGTTSKTLIYNFNEDPYWVRAFKQYKNDYIAGQLIDEILTDNARSEVRQGQGGPQNAREAAAAKISDLVTDAAETAYEGALNATNDAVDRLRNIAFEPIRRWFGS
jgi:hypothetical protein